MRLSKQKDYKIKSSSKDNMKKVTLGLTEPITIKGNNGKKLEITARIDTGATASSIDLNLAEELALGPAFQSRMVKSASGVKRRPIVTGKIVIKGIELEEEFNLANRSHMTYRMLIGQNILKKGSFIIDPSDHLENLSEAEKNMKK